MKSNKNERREPLSEAERWEKEMRQKWWATWLAPLGTIVVAGSILAGFVQQSRLLTSQHEQATASQQHQWRQYLFDKRLELCKTIANAALRIREAKSIEDIKNEVDQLDNARGQSLILLDGETNRILEALILRLRKNGLERTVEGFKSKDDYQVQCAMLIQSCRSLQIQLVAATKPEDIKAVLDKQFVLEVIGPGPNGERAPIKPVFQ